MQGIVRMRKEIGQVVATAVTHSLCLKAYPHEGYGKADCVCVCVCVYSSNNCSTVAMRRKLTASIGF